MVGGSPGATALAIILLLAAFVNAGPINRKWQKRSVGDFNSTDNIFSQGVGGECVTEHGVYHGGESVPSPGPCETCTCRPPSVFCQMVRCPINPGCRTIQRANQCCPDYRCECEHDGKTYNNGEKIVIPEQPCQVCYCKGGEVMCTSITCYQRDDCEPRYIPGQCCPKYDHCPPLDSNDKKSDSGGASVKTSRSSNSGYKREMQPWLLTQSASKDHENEHTRAYHPSTAQQDTQTPPDDTQVDRKQPNTVIFTEMTAEEVKTKLKSDADAYENDRKGANGGDGGKSGGDGKDEGKGEDKVKEVGKSSDGDEKSNESVETGEKGDEKEHGSNVDKEVKDESIIGSEKDRRVDETTISGDDKTNTKIENILGNTESTTDGYAETYMTTNDQKESTTDFSTYNPEIISDKTIIDESTNPMEMEDNFILNDVSTLYNIVPQDNTESTLESRGFTTVESEDGTTSSPDLKEFISTGVTDEGGTNQYGDYVRDGEGYSVSGLEEEVSTENPLRDEMNNVEKSGVVTTEGIPTTVYPSTTTESVLESTVGVEPEERFEKPVEDGKTLEKQEVETKSSTEETLDREVTSFVTEIDDDDREEKTKRTLLPERLDRKYTTAIHPSQVAHYDEKTKLDDFRLHNENMDKNRNNDVTETKYGIIKSVFISNKDDSLTGDVNGNYDMMGTTGVSTLDIEQNDEERSSTEKMSTKDEMDDGKVSVESLEDAETKQGTKENLIKKCDPKKKQSKAVVSASKKNEIGVGEKKMKKAVEEGKGVKGEKGIEVEDMIKEELVDDEKGMNVGKNNSSEKSEDSSSSSSSSSSDDSKSKSGDKDDDSSDSSSSSSSSSSESKEDKSKNKKSKESESSSSSSSKSDDSKSKSKSDSSDSSSSEYDDSKSKHKSKDDSSDSSSSSSSSSESDDSKSKHKSDSSDSSSSSSSSESDDSKSKSKSKDDSSDSSSSSSSSSESDDSKSKSKSKDDSSDSSSSSSSSESDDSKSKSKSKDDSSDSSSSSSSSSESDDSKSKHKSDSSDSSSSSSSSESDDSKSKSKSKDDSSDSSSSSSSSSESDDSKSKDKSKSDSSDSSSSSSSSKSDESKSKKDSDSSSSSKDKSKSESSSSSSSSSDSSDSSKSNDSKSKSDSSSSSSSSSSDSSESKEVLKKPDSSEESSSSSSESDESREEKSERKPKSDSSDSSDSKSKSKSDSSDSSSSSSSSESDDSKSKKLKSDSSDSSSSSSSSESDDSKSKKSKSDSSSSSSSSSSESNDKKFKNKSDSDSSSSSSSSSESSESKSKSDSSSSSSSSESDDSKSKMKSDSSDSSSSSSSSESKSKDKSKSDSSDSSSSSESSSSSSESDDSKSKDKTKSDSSDSSSSSSSSESHESKKKSDSSDSSSSSSSSSESKSKDKSKSDSSDSSSSSSSSESTEEKTGEKSHELKSTDNKSKNESSSESSSSSSSSSESDDKSKAEDASIESSTASSIIAPGSKHDATHETKTDDKIEVTNQKAKPNNAHVGDKRKYKMASNLIKEKDGQDQLNDDDDVIVLDITNNNKDEDNLKTGEPTTFHLDLFNLNDEEDDVEDGDASKTRKGSSKQSQRPMIKVMVQNRKNLNISNSQIILTPADLKLLAEYLINEKIKPANQNHDYDDKDSSKTNSIITKSLINNGDLTMVLNITTMSDIGVGKEFTTEVNTVTEGLVGNEVETFKPSDLMKDDKKSDRLVEKDEDVVDCGEETTTSGSTLSGDQRNTALGEETKDVTNTEEPCDEETDTQTEAITTDLLPESTEYPDVHTTLSDDQILKGLIDLMRKTTELKDEESTTIYTRTNNGETSTESVDSTTKRKLTGDKNESNDESFLRKVDNEAGKESYTATLDDKDLHLLKDFMRKHLNIK